MKKSLNIKFKSKDWRGEILSNLANTPFRIGHFLFPSAESALQGIKFRDKTRREEVFKLDGINALRAGREITDTINQGKKSNFIYWDNQKILYNSSSHRLLIAMFLHEKVRQNVKVQEALLDTERTFIYHDVGIENPSTSLPERFYIQILLSQRDLLRKLLDIV